MSTEAYYHYNRKLANCLYKPIPIGRNDKEEKYKYLKSKLRIFYIVMLNVLGTAWQGEELVESSFSAM